MQPRVPQTPAEKGSPSASLPSLAPTITAPPTAYPNPHSPRSASWPEDEKTPLPSSTPSLKEFLQPSSTKAAFALPRAPMAAKGPKRRASLWIRWQLWFNTYRKFFTVVMCFNFTLLILTITGHFDYARDYTAAMVLGNLLCAILMRNELFGRVLYWVLIKSFAKWAPLKIRLGVTSVLQHLGGIHSGCALSGCMWLVYKVSEIFINHKLQSNAVLTMGVVTNIAVLISVLSAFPWVRNTHHNVFERHHRFIGWLGLACTWVFVILGNSYDPEYKLYSPSGSHLIGAQEFWYALGMTVFVIIPWFTVREVPVDIELPSPKVAIIRFQRGMQQGLLGRISRSSIMEYHAFGIVSEGVHAKYHYMVCGVQGDFTRSLVNDPPPSLWTRQLKFAGVSNTSTLYHRGIRVCTGTGIGASLSTCLQSPDWFLIWIGSDQDKTFGPTISGLIQRHIEPERLILWDSKKRGGRPDTMALVKEAYARWNAEVVMITSNYIGNTELMEGCREAGIPAFGTLWDF